MEEATYRVVRKQDEQRYTLGVVYEPGVLDTDSDFATGPTIRKAAYGFMAGLQGLGKVSRKSAELLGLIQKALEDGGELRLDVTDVLPLGKGALGTMHEDWDDSIGDIVGSLVLDFPWQIDEDTLLKEDTWLLAVVWGEEAFEKVKDGELTGLSLGGRAHRVERPAAAAKQEADVNELKRDPTRTKTLRADYSGDMVKRLGEINRLASDAIRDTMVFGDTSQR